MSAEARTAPAQITLRWVQDSGALPNSYIVHRRAPTDTSWGTGVVLPGSTTRYVDTRVEPGVPFEYQIVKNAASHTGYGYIYAGVQVPAAERRGRLLLVVDRTHTQELAVELDRLQQDLVGDGWTVTRLDVNRTDSVSHVKSRIKREYDADPANVKAVFLFGRVPVPYSGDIVPDGHYGEHEGAWPSDGYYGDMDGLWTDRSVMAVRAADPRNHNVPGDGKFDQSVFPAPLKLMVGRVDLSNMPGRMVPGGPATFPTEVELLRNYLNKNHKFRNKIITVPERAIVGDYFGTHHGEAFAASGWRNFAPFFGADGITSVTDKGAWIPTLMSNAHLWAYGCGSGSYTSIGGIGSFGRYRDGLTTELVQGNIQAVFTMLYGSWLGDWDSEDNLQRAVLATPDYGLTCSWSGRPHWFMQHMALGAPIGFSTLQTQNNGFTGLYQNYRNNCVNWVHIALMGDPTLRMHVVAPPLNVEAGHSTGSTILSWMPSSDAVEGYHVYRAQNPEGPYTRINDQPITSSMFADANPTHAAGAYMVRAVNLQTSASGTYYNLSQGAFAVPAAFSQEIAETTNTAPVRSSQAAIQTPPATVAVEDSLQTPAAHGETPLPSEHNVSSAEIRLTPTGTENEPAWVDDTVPAGALPDASGGDAWNWVSSDPTPFSGAVAHQSAVASGMHQHFFTGAAQPMIVNPGDTLYAYVYLDPAHIPSQVMLQWYSDDWAHRAYWGVKELWWGTEGTAASRNMGALPAAGQWIRLEVPASQVGLDGKAVTGMAFTLFGGRATWDNAGKSSGAIPNPPSTNPTNTVPGGGVVTPVGTNESSVVDTDPPPVVSTNLTSTTSNTPPAASLSPNTNGLLPGTLVVDNIALRMPEPGDYALRVLTPTLLELKLINAKDPDPARVTQWDWVNNAQFAAPPLNAFAVTVNGQPVSVQGVGFKRRPLYAPLVGYDLRIDNSLYLQLNTPVSDHQIVEVKNPDGALWSTSMQFVATMDPLRYSPAIHVNQEGYMPGYSKKGMVGFYLGSMGEMNVSASSGFKLVDAATGATVHQGSLVPRADVGYRYTPKPYQQVFEAEFTGFTTPGQYRLVVPGLGASLPFHISAGIAMNFARTYALGLYHQRCGTDNALPYTRYTHDTCHHAPAVIPSSAAAFPFTWKTISNYSQFTYDDRPIQTAPKLTGPEAQRFPFLRQGNIDVSGGHHDAGDYSKYTLNSVALIHYLMFAVDSMQGVAGLDNLGLPESGDGISDIMQEAKWEADFLAKMQDLDGGFYFLVYPQNREYEGNVMPDNGDPQLVWPKTSSATAASVAALAQCASSPAFKAAYPQAAALYLQKARLGWQFLTNGIARFGKGGMYQKITHYGDDFADHDELAWAACEMYLATGEAQYQQALFDWFPDPTDPSTFRWGWWRMYLYYGNAVRSYAFAARSGRLPASQLNAGYLARCEATVLAAGDDLVKWSKQNAYGTSFPEETKIYRGAGWYFSGDQTFDITVAYQITPKPDYLTAIIENMNYEGGCNPVNVSYVTGLGWKRQRDAVSQFSANDRRILPSTGMPMGNIQWGFSYLDQYRGSLSALCFPSDDASPAPYPFYDRWGDSWNVSTEFVAFQQARSLATYAFLAGRSPFRGQAWKPVQGEIIVPSGRLVGPITFSMQAPGLDLSQARIAWETRDGDVGMGQTFTVTPRNNGTQWIEAEALMSDGRRVFAEAEFTAETANVVWVDDSVPAGANISSEGGDSWSWITGNPAPISGNMAHQSANASGVHQHFFRDATATMNVESGTVLYAYIYLDPANPPTEAMLQWNDGSSWEHRAYWGANSIAYGIDGTASRRYMGPLPTAGQWHQLQVPASLVGLEGKTVSGMAFTLMNGRAIWDAAGLMNPAITNGTGGSDSHVPVITVSSTDASRVTSVPGEFRFTRTGNTNSALNIRYILNGTAQSGIDYDLPNSNPSLASVAAPSVTIPAGATSGTLTVTPRAAADPAEPKTVVLAVTSDTGYDIGSPANATLIIGGNAVPAPSLSATSGGPKLSWQSTSGGVYRVAYKNRLSDSVWTYASGDIPAAGSITSWSDTDKRSQRFYLVVRVQ